MMRLGSGIDVHHFSDDPDRALVIGGVTMPAGPGLAGHSDADVLTHAVTDALLGALGVGDLGSRFGVDHPDVAGARSLDLLAEVVRDVAAAGYEIGNLDTTVVAERPRLASYRDEMRRNLSEVLAAPVDQVSVKFTTADGLGSMGRGEGIAAWATCLLVRSRG